MIVRLLKNERLTKTRSELNN